MTGHLAAYVHVADEHGATHAFGPGSEVPEWAARKIVNPKAWVGGKAPYPYDESKEREQKPPAAPADLVAEVDHLRAELARVTAERDERLTLEESSRLAKMVDDLRDAAERPLAGSTDGPPPKGGAGSGAPEWRAYCGRKNVEVADDASREDCIAALTAAGVPTE